MDDRKTQAKATLYNRDIYLVYLIPNKWSVIIMPENIIIDNHHISYPHIHPNPKKHCQKEEIILKNPEEVYNKVMEHIEENKGLKLKKLMEELKE
jgi:hypothetical protein